MPGDDWQKFANLRLLYGYQYGQPGKKLLFMGDELAPVAASGTTSARLDWHLLDDPAHAGVARWVADLNRLYRWSPPCTSSTPSRRASSGSGRRRRQASLIGFLRRSSTGTWSWSSATSPRCPATTS